MMVKCQLCEKRGDEFTLPWDEIGEALMRAHMEDKHPDVTLPARVNYVHPVERDTSGLEGGPW
jgi:hypothetical protein